MHLIITDIGMPRMNGLEAIAVIRKMSESVPIMILSIWEEADYIKIAKQVGVKEYMKKPFDIQEFISNVRGIIPETPSEKSAA